MAIKENESISQSIAAVDEAQPKINPKWLTLGVVGFGTYMSALDSSIVNIILPIIGKTTQSPVSTIEWVILIYLITVSSTLLLFGRLADIYGRRQMYISGIAVFTIGSLLCGLTNNIGFLIASRAVQAIGAAMMFALGPAVVISAFPSEEIGKALGLQATMTYLGLTTGPAVGGFLSQHFGWHSIFFINVPLGIVAVLVALRVLKRERSSSVQPFDPAGAALMAVALSTLLYALSQGPEKGWHSPLIVTMFAVSVACWVAFVIIEQRVSHPALDFHLFRNRIFSASTLAAFLCYLAQSAVNFLMPFYLLRAKGLPEARAGLIMMATPVTMMLLTGPSGYLSDKIGVKIPATTGMVVIAAGILGLHWLTPGASTVNIVPYLAMIGIGAGLFTSPNNSAIMGSAPEERRGVAGALLAAARTTGFATGVALAGLIYISRLNSMQNVTEPIAITAAVKSGMIVIACIALVGALLSAVRGSTLPNKSVKL